LDLVAAQGPARARPPAPAGGQRGGGLATERLQRGQPPRPRVLQQPLEQLGGGAGVVQGGVAATALDPELRAAVDQPVTVQAWVQAPGEIQSTQHRHGR
jgi:hypothetical protein